MTGQPANRTGRIDVQFHFSPPFYTDLIKATSYIGTDRWSADAALAYMDANHVAAGVMSVSTPGVDFLPPAQAPALARRLNDAAAAVARDHPGRFGNFATLPMQDPDAALAEIGYCLDVLGMDGVAMMSNVGGRYLGHDRFAPVFDELNRRRAVIFIHPTDPVYGDPPAMASVAEWPFDTTRAAIDLIYSGTIRRCPDISVILAHAGGALPMVSNRVLGMSSYFSTAQPPVTPAEVGGQIAGFYYDLAISAGEYAIGALRGVSNLEHVLFACDWPFAPDAAVAANISGFEALSLTGAERHAIERGNAERLFPKLAGAPVAGPRPVTGQR
jgi:predicted TIM-barrel fold metal-dependent hydrolase